MKDELVPVLTYLPDGESGPLMLTPDLLGLLGTELVGTHAADPGDPEYVTKATIGVRLMTQAEIDAMPEHPGW